MQLLAKFKQILSRFYHFFPLFLTIPCDLYILIQHLIIMLLRNVMLTVPRELGLPVLFVLPVCSFWH